MKFQLIGKVTEHRHFRQSRMHSTIGRGYPEPGPLIDSGCVVPAEADTESRRPLSSMSGHLPILFATLLWLSVTFLSGSCQASNSLSRRSSAGALPTLGGHCHWTDFLVDQGWRIQRHVARKEYRLLDEDNRRVAKGSWGRCLTEIDQRRCRGELKPLPRHVVVVMHGLAGSRRLMQGLVDHLEEQGGFTVLNVGYASTKGTVQEQAIALECVLSHLEGVSEVSFVCHSMSNIIVRHMLYRFRYMGQANTLRFRRMVMISPPNQGAELADRVVWGFLGRTFLGPPAYQLAPEKGWPELEKKLVHPDFEFGILAGGRCDQRGYLRSLPGDDDGLLTIRTHYLEGAKDFRRIGGLHQLMPLTARTKQATLKFLKQGHF